jgi:exodeoxyribonuclease III
MKIYSWNVNGIRAAHKKGLLDWILKTDADILCLQEVRAELDQIPAEYLSIPGYTAYWNPAERKGYSGTAILTKHKPLEVNVGWGETEFDCEGRIVQAVFENFIVNSVYFPNGSNGL